MRHLSSIFLSLTLIFIIFDKASCQEDLKQADQHPDKTIYSGIAYFDSDFERSLNLFSGYYDEGYFKDDSTLIVKVFIEIDSNNILFYQGSESDTSYRISQVSLVLDSVKTLPNESIYYASLPKNDGRLRLNLQNNYGLTYAIHITKEEKQEITMNYIHVGHKENPLLILK